MGGKKTTTNSTSDSTGTVTKTNPQWVTDALQKYTGAATGLLNQDPQSFVAPQNALQTQAGVGAAGLGDPMLYNNANGLIGASAGMTTNPGTTGRVGGASLLSNLDAYQNPYTNDVVNTTLGDYDVNSGRTRAAQAATAAGAGAFGGSRFGVREAQTEGDLARGRATTEAGLRDQGFNTAAGLANEDANRAQQAELANQQAQAGDLSRSTTAQMTDAQRRLQAGGLMGTLADSQASSNRANVTTQEGVGNDQRAIADQQAQAPLGVMGAIGNILGNGQYGLFNGADTTDHTVGTGTSKTSGGLLDALGTLGVGAGMLGWKPFG